MEIEAHVEVVEAGGRGELVVGGRRVEKSRVVVEVVGKRKIVDVCFGGIRVNVRTAFLIPLSTFLIQAKQA